MKNLILVLLVAPVLLSFSSSFALPILCHPLMNVSMNKDARPRNYQEIPFSHLQAGDIIRISKGSDNNLNQSSENRIRKGPYLILTIEQVPVNSKTVFHLVRLRTNSKEWEHLQINVTSKDIISMEIENTNLPEFTAKLIAKSKFTKNKRERVEKEPRTTTKEFELFNPGNILIHDKKVVIMTGFEKIYGGNDPQVGSIDSAYNFFYKELSIDSNGNLQVSKDKYSFFIGGYDNIQIDMPVFLGRVILDPLNGFGNKEIKKIRKILISKAGIIELVIINWDRVELKFLPAILTVKILNLERAVSNP